MDSNQLVLLLILFSPLIAGVLVLLIGQLGDGAAKWSALIFSLVPLALTIYLWVAYQGAPADPNGFKFVFSVPWLPQMSSSFTIGIDGISLAMILLTAILTPLGILISFRITDRLPLFMALLLGLTTGMFGVFMALDLVIFFIFWEIGLVPMYFLINQWGSANRQYASLKFFIYTMAGSIGLLLSIQFIWSALGTYSIPQIAGQWSTYAGPGVLGLPIETVKNITFWLFVIAFAIKVPVWPFHTWLPDAHTEAPTAGSMILAGVLLKLGAFGFLRLVLPFFPQQSAQFAVILALLALAGIIFTALAAFGQNDFKRLVAYSSVNHMGFVVLGIATAAAARGNAAYQQSAIIATNGAVLQMFAHGLSAAAMFALVGVVYERAHTRDLNQLGGLWKVMPIYGGILVFSAMANLGLPGLAGFPAEFQVVSGSWPVFTLTTALSMMGLLLTGAYILKAIQKVLHGPVNRELLHHAEMPDINRREIIALAPLLVLMLAVGVYPMWLMTVINDGVVNLLRIAGG
ncbi:NADH-quinone oxidoreductase subunit M [Thermoflexales bacterium]|nr:NADH-quinone oxidoreductase subunit M [Thermoflexales bacterium]